MEQTHFSGCYSLKEIEQAFSLHYATVSQRGMMGVLQCKT